MIIIIPKGFSATDPRRAERFDSRIRHRPFTLQNGQTRTNKEPPVIPTNSARRTEQLYERNRIMTITRGFAAGAMLAGLALVVTAPVSTADPLNGHYIETETYPDGHQVHSDWFITPAVTAAPRSKSWVRRTWSTGSGRWTARAAFPAKRAATSRTRSASTTHGIRTR